MKKLLLILLCLPMIGFGQCILGDCENGYGKFITLDDIIYKGEFKDGTLHGLVTFIWPSGNRYVGEFKNGDRNGLGTFTWHSELLSQKGFYFEMHQIQTNKES